MDNLLQKHVEEFDGIIKSLPWSQYEEKVKKLAEKILRCANTGGKVLICGNGGSAADSQHLAAEMVVRYKKNRKALPAVALTTDTSILTAAGNDFDFNSIFSRQIEALGNENDLLIAFSTSGNSQNVINAVMEALKKNMDVFCFLGKDGGKLGRLAEENITVPSVNTPIIQGIHLILYHTLCDYLEINLN